MSGCQTNVRVDVLHTLTAAPRPPSDFCCSSLPIASAVWSFCCLCLSSLKGPSCCDHAKLTDFGFARRCDPGVKSLTNTLGSPLYMSPEVVAYKQTRQPYGAACDMWAVGVMAYAFISGTYPFTGDTVPDIFASIKSGLYPAMTGGVWDNVSADLTQLVATLLAVDPAKRPTAREALEHPALHSPVKQPMPQGVAPEHTLANDKTNIVSTDTDLTASDREVRRLAARRPPPVDIPATQLAAALPRSSSSDSLASSIGYSTISASSSFCSSAAPDTPVDLRHNSASLASIYPSTPSTPFDWRRVSLPVAIPTPTTPCTPIDRPSVFLADSAPGTPLSAHDWRRGSLPVAGPTPTTPLFTAVNCCWNSAALHTQYAAAPHAPMAGRLTPFGTRPIPTTPCATVDYRRYSVTPYTPCTPKW